MHPKSKALCILSTVAVAIIISVIAFAPAAANAGSFQKTFGGASDEYGLSVKQTFDGGFILAGWTRSMGHGSRDVYLIKTDSKGDLQWEKALGGLLTEEGNSVVQSPDGGYVVAGSSTSFGAGPSDMYLLKTDSQGRVVWQRSYGGFGREAGMSVAPTSDGGYAVVGTTDSSGAGADDVYLVRTDSAGKRLWQKTFGGEGNEEGMSVAQTSDGGYILAGTKAAELQDFYLIKTDAEGNLRWEKTFGGDRVERGFSVIQADDGGYVAVGTTSSSGAGSTDAYLVKTDAEGNLEWEKTFGGEDYDEVSAVRQTPDGGYILAGWTASSGKGLADVYLIKTDSGGNEEWTRTFGGKEDDEVYSLDLTSDGGYVVGGYTKDLKTGLFDVLLLKTGKSGK